MRALFLLLTMAVFVPIPAAAQAGPGAKDILIRDAPAGYALSPESEGITGPFDEAKARQFGLPADAFSGDRSDGLEDSYLRAWIHENQTDVIVAIALKATDEPAAAAMFKGAVDAATARSDESFAIDLPDGRGLITPTPDQGGGPTDAYSAVFRRGLYVFNLTTLSQSRSSPDLVRELATEQFERAPEGPTGTAALDAAERAYQAGGLVGRFILAAIVLAVIVVLVRRSRSTPTPTPPVHPAAPAPNAPPHDQ